MNNVSTINLPVSTFGNVDDILVNASGSAGRIKKADFLGSMNDWSNVMNKPFENFDATYFRTTERSDGADILTLSDSVIAYFQAISNLQNSIGDVNNRITDTNLRVSTLESTAHSHDNKTVIDLFTASDNKLLWNGIAVGSDCELPIATTSEIGGVKPDGTTITVDSDGTIHGASQGLDFDALSTAMTTGTQSGITVTADTENSRFNFEVTGIPTIAIDNEGYWTINGDRGTNPTKAQGEKGKDGINPTASVIATESGATITITDSSSTTTVDISNGIDGTDGISPTAVISDTENGASITITDKNGTTTVEVFDGANGISPHIDNTTNHWFIGETDTGIGATASIDDTSTDGTDVTWSANKINSVIGDINAVLASVTGGIS